MNYLIKIVRNLHLSREKSTLMSLTFNRMNLTRPMIVTPLLSCFQEAQVKFFENISVLKL